MHPFQRLVRATFLLGMLLAGGLRVLGGSAAETNLWEAEIPRKRAASGTWVRPDVLRAFHLHQDLLRPLLDQAPKESARRAEVSDALISLPMPDGTLARFRFVEAPVMAPELAAKFPRIKTFLGRGLDDPTARVRFDLTPSGFHAQILSPKGAVYIDPYLRGDTNLHVVYYKRDYRRSAEDFHCLIAQSEAVTPAPKARAAQVNAPGGLRTYRLACAATAEYTQYFGGTVADGLAAIVTAINRVTGVYESEVAIRLVLVANDDQIIFTNVSTEPYNNGNAYQLLSENQTTIDAVIGDANYDVGHVFGTAGGGLAEIGVVSTSGIKAMGETGAYPPVGDPFYIDYVAHEMGHQFGAYHPFNSSDFACGGNRNAATAYEPGSGSTIMAYAGICGSDDLQAHSDPYFHSASLEEIIDYTTEGAGNNASALSPTTNTVPSVEAGPAFTIPMGTPFTLTATSGDADGDALTYCWEERDLGPSIVLTAPDNGSSPLFRSFLPTNSLARTFPQWSDILANTSTPGEMLPTTGRTLNFRVTARDNSASGGLVASADTQVTVTTNAGPFVVTSPGASVTWSNEQTITWNVAGTASAPVNATNVNILLSTNGGLSFPIVLAANVPNNGSQTVLLPDLETTNARVEVQAAGNIFFAVSPADFTIEGIGGGLAVSQTVSPAPWLVGSNLTYTITVTNRGPQPAHNIVVSDALSPAVILTSVGFNQGKWNYDDGVVTVSVGTVAGQSCAEIMLTATVIAPGTVTNDITMSKPAITDSLIVDASQVTPLLAPIANYTIHAGSVLLITNAAAGADVPGGALAFSLDPGAPSGASIDPVSGVLAWQTSPGNAGTTNFITVRVTDTAAPTLSAAQSFEVTVLPPPALQPPSLLNGAMSISWTAIPGQTYRIQYKDNLTDANWIDLPTAMTATDVSATMTDPVSPLGRRFYRIVVAP